MSEAPDPYKVLQVDPEAEDEVIQAAFRRLAQKYHPDVARGPDAESRMATINAAWEILGDPARRAAHDRARDRAVRETGPTAAPEAARPGDAGRRPAAGPAGHGRPPAARSASDAASAASPRRAETVSTDWTSGRSSYGGGYDRNQMGAPDGLGAAGPPPGDPSGSVLTFGRFAGWSLGEIARHDLEYIEWLDRVPIGRIHRDEIDAILRRTGRRRSAATEAQERRGLFRRR